MSTALVLSPITKLPATASLDTVAAAAAQASRNIAAVVQIRNPR